MKLSTTQILQQINDVNAKIQALGPVLIGTLKKNKCRKTRTDGSRYVSENEYHTFVYRDHQGKEAWKRIPERDLPAFQKWVGAGREYKQLAARFARLSTQLTLASNGKKNAASRNPNS